MGKYIPAKMCLQSTDLCNRSELLNYDINNNKHQFHRLYCTHNLYMTYVMCLYAQNKIC